MTDILTHCEHCSTRFEAPEASAGGMTNCISCGRATAVPGGPDIVWMALCGLALAVGAVIVGFVAQHWGSAAGLAAMGVCGVIGLIAYLSS